MTGYLALFITSILFGSYGLWIRLIGNELNAYQQIVIRYGLIALLIGIFVFIRHIKFPAKNIPSFNLVLYALSIPGSFILFNLAMLSGKLSVSVVGFYFGVIITGIIIGGLFFKEKFTLIGKISLLFSILGLVFLLLPISRDNLNWGFILGSGSGLVYGVANSFKKKLVGKVPKSYLLLIASIASVIITLLFIGKGPMVPTTLQPSTVFFTIVYALTALLAEYLTLIGFKKTDLNLGSIILSGEIVFAGIIGYLFFHETLSTVELLGITSIFIAIILPSISGLSKRK